MHLTDFAAVPIVIAMSSPNCRGDRNVLNRVAVIGGRAIRTLSVVLSGF